MSDIVITKESKDGRRGRYAAQIDGIEGIGEITFTVQGDHLISADHTGVPKSIRNAVKATGRNKVVMCGLWTEVCCAFPTLDMLREDFEVYPVIDAIGGISKTSHESAITRMVQAGAQPVTAISFGSKLMRNWARDTSDEFRKVLRWYFPLQHEIADKQK